MSGSIQIFRLKAPSCSLVKSINSRLSSPLTRYFWVTCKITFNKSLSSLSLLTKLIDSRIRMQKYSQHSRECPVNEYSYWQVLPFKITLKNCGLCLISLNQLSSQISINLSTISETFKRKNKSIDYNHKSNHIYSEEWRKMLKIGMHTLLLLLLCFLVFLIFLLLKSIPPLQETIIDVEMTTI